MKNLLLSLLNSDSLGCRVLMLVGVVGVVTAGGADFDLSLAGLSSSGRDVVTSSVDRRISVSLLL